jgi:hypothetical protein
MATRVVVHVLLHRDRSWGYTEDFWECRALVSYRVEEFLVEAVLNPIPDSVVIGLSISTREPNCLVI